MSTSSNSTNKTTSNSFPKISFDSSNISYLNENKKYSDEEIMFFIETYNELEQYDISYEVSMKFLTKRNRNQNNLNLNSLCKSDIKTVFYGIRFFITRLFDSWQRLIEHKELIQVKELNTSINNSEDISSLSYSPLKSPRKLIKPAQLRHTNTNLTSFLGGVLGVTGDMSTENYQTKNYGTNNNTNNTNNQSISDNTILNSSTYLDDDLGLNYEMNKYFNEKIEEIEKIIKSKCMEVVSELEKLIEFTESKMEKEKEKYEENNKDEWALIFYLENRAFTMCCYCSVSDEKEYAHLLEDTKKQYEELYKKSRSLNYDYLYLTIVLGYSVFLADYLGKVQDAYYLVEEYYNEAIEVKLKSKEFCIGLDQLQNKLIIWKTELM